MKYIVIFLLTIGNLHAQKSKLLDRLVALENGGKTWYNIDGYSITSEISNHSFDEKGLKKVFKKYAIRENAVKINDDLILRSNLVVRRSEKINEYLLQRNSYYFLENNDKRITVIWFTKAAVEDLEMQRELTNLIIENKIPNANFVSMQTNQINFGNRQIKLGNNCYWTFLNSVQCPYFGQMNWSVHKSLEDSKKSVENQLEITKSQKKGKVLSEEFVDVEFENIPTKAKKVVYDFTGLTGVLTGISGGKTLTTYYVSEKVRENYMSCVMSFWNNDQINPATKLPPLLEKVMIIK